MSLPLGLRMQVQQMIRARSTLWGVARFNTYVPQGRAIDHIMYRYNRVVCALKRWIDNTLRPMIRWSG